MRTKLISLACLLMGLLLSPFLILQAQAHFTVGTDARVIHVAPASKGGGISIFLRIPGPLAYGAVLSERLNPNDIIQAPFLQMKMVQGVPFYSVDQHMIHNNSDEFSRFLASGYALTLEGKEVEAEVVRSAYFSSDEHPEYDNAEDARATLKAFAATASNADEKPIYVADALFDLELFVPTKTIAGTLTIHNAFPEFALPPEVVIENLVLDHRFDPPRSIQFSGQMMDPVTLNGSWIVSLGNFIWQGIVHILIGLDHVLFVVCLALASGLSRSILWSVTGFTIGHSITLYLGSIGLVPEGIWFIPAVETAIAASILYAALLIILRQKRQNLSNVMIGTNLFIVAALIGLVHGYGFSFVLGDLLGGDAGQLVLALIGFNLGVEAGQLGIVLVVFAILWAAAKIHALLPRGLSYAGSLIAIGFSLFWCWERAGFLVSLMKL